MTCLLRHPSGTFPQPCVALRLRAASHISRIVLVSTPQKISRTRFREVALQIVYCQSFSDKSLGAAISAVEATTTAESFSESLGSLREAQHALKEAISALEEAQGALLKAAKAEEPRKTVKTDHALLTDRTHAVHTKRAAIETAKKAIRAIEVIDPLFDEKAYSCRIVELFHRNREKVESALERCLEGWALRRLTAEDGAALRLGVTELLYCTDVPTAVIIDEYVELAKRYGDVEAPKLVNGVLDRVQREFPREQA